MFGIHKIFNCNIPVYLHDPICAKIYTHDSYVTLLLQQNKCNVKNTFIAKHGTVTHMMINKNVHVCKIPYDVQSV